MGCDQMILTFDAYPPQHHRVLGDSPKHILTMNMEKHGEKKNRNDHLVGENVLVHYYDNVDTCRL